MSVTDDHRKLLTAAREAMTSYFVPRQKLQEMTRAYSERSRKAGHAYRQKIQDKALAAAGINPEDIHKRHAANDRSDRAFIESLQPIFEDNARLAGERNQQLIAGLRTPHSHAGGPAPAASPVWAILDTAAAIEPDQGSSGLPGFSASIASFNNLIHFELGPSAQSYNVAAYFIWTPPQSGMLGATSIVAFNGSDWWAAQHGCIESLIEQDGWASLFFISPGASQPLGPFGTQSYLSVYRDWTPSCSTDIGTKIIDTPVYLEAPSATAVTGGKPIVIATVLSVDFFADEVTGRIDFATFNKAINVAGIFVNVA